MKVTRLFHVIMILIIASQESYSQSLAVNTDGSAANASAILDVKSSVKGVLIPRMLKSEKQAISSPAAGLMIYQTGPDSTGFYIYNGSTWDWAITTGNSSGIAGWKTTGNSGLSPATNFIGNTDNVPIKFRVFNSTAGQIDYTNQVTCLGSLAGNVLNGADNTAIGAKALFASNVGVNNTAVGSNSLAGNTSGNNNTGLGYYAASAVSNGTYNTAVGANAMLSATGSNNTAVGAQTMASTVTGSNNTAIGYGSNISSGLSNATAIGYNASVTQSNSIVLGNGTVNVGIGTNAPQHLLHVGGTITCMKGANTHTGFFYNATSSSDGIELVALSTTDAFASIQRGAGGYCLHLGKGSSAVNQGILGFYVNGVDIGHVDCDVAGTNVTYYTTSDQRLKENIRPTRYGLEKLMQIQVADYNYKADEQKHNQTGFLAQQLYTVYPQAVKPGGDDPKTQAWSVDYGRLTPILVQAVQDQQILINAQNEKIASLTLMMKDMNEKLEQLGKAPISK